MYPDILNGLIFDAAYGSRILSLLLFTLGITNGLATSNALISKHSIRNTQSRVFMH